MDAPTNDTTFWQYLAHVATATVLAIGGFVMRGHVKRVEEIEKCYVSREELQDFMVRMAEERKSMHEENRDRLDSLTQRIDNILHRRA